MVVYTDYMEVTEVSRKLPVKCECVTRPTVNEMIEYLEQKGPSFDFRQFALKPNE